MKSWSDLKESADRFSGKNLGVEEDIVLKSGDPVLRYWMWFLKFWGIELTNTYKCNMYQTMFWGTLFIILTSPLLFLGALINRLKIYTFNRRVPISLRNYASGLVGLAAIFAIIALVYNIYWIGVFILILVSLPAMIIFVIILLLWVLLKGVMIAFSWLGVQFFYLFLEFNWHAILMVTAYPLLAVLLLMGIIYFFNKIVGFFIDSWIYRNMVKLFFAIYQRLPKTEIPKKVRTESVDYDYYVPEKNSQELEKIKEIFSKIFAYIKKMIYIVFYPVIWAAKGIYYVFLIFKDTLNNHCPPVRFEQDIDYKGVVLRKVGNIYSYINFPNDLGLPEIIVFTNMCELTDKFDDLDMVDVKCTISLVPQYISMRMALVPVADKECIINPA
jgi:hypothetical protein